MITPGWSVLSLGEHTTSGPMLRFGGVPIAGKYWGLGLHAELFSHTCRTAAAGAPGLSTPAADATLCDDTFGFGFVFSGVLVATRPALKVDDQ